MLYKIGLTLLLAIFIFFESFIEIFRTSDEKHLREISKEITIDEDEIRMFEKKSVDNITINQNKIEVWLIIVNYNNDNYNQIKSKLSQNGYEIKHNKKNMKFSIGPYADISQAKKESSRLKKLLGIDNRISSFIF